MPLGVAREIDQHVDPVVAHLPAEGVVVEPHGRAPMRGAALEPFGRLVGQRDLGVAERLDAGAVVKFEERLEEIGNGMSFEVRRHVADAQAAAGIRRIGERRGAAGPGRGDSVVAPRPVALADERGARAVVDRPHEVEAALGNGIRGRSLAILRVGRLRAALRAQHLAERAAGRRERRIELDGAPERGLRLARPSVAKQRHAQVVMGFGLAGREADPLADRLLGGAKPQRLIEALAKIDMRRPVAGIDRAGAPQGRLRFRPRGALEQPDAKRVEVSESALTQLLGGVGLADAQRHLPRPQRHVGGSAIGVKLVAVARDRVAIGLVGVGEVAERLVAFAETAQQHGIAAAAAQHHAVNLNRGLVLAGALLCETALSERGQFGSRGHLSAFVVVYRE